MSRTAVGWIPTKVDVSKKLDTCELDDIDGLSAEDMAEVVRHECSVKAPLDAQQVADDQADAWGQMWGVGLANDGAIAAIEAAADPPHPAAAPHAGT